MGKTTMKTRPKETPEKTNKGQDLTLGDSSTNDSFSNVFSSENLRPALMEPSLMWIYTCDPSTEKRNNGM